MLLDQDFDIIENISDAVKFAGRYRAVFTSNIYSRDFYTDKNECETHLVANANLIIEGTDKMYRCYVQFPKDDIFFYNSPSGGYYLPATYIKGKRTNRGLRLKGNSFEIVSTMTHISNYKRYNKLNGQFETISHYRISVAANDLKKIEDVDTTPYQLILNDCLTENTRVIEDVPLIFNGHHKIQFLTGLYHQDILNDNGHYSREYYANAVVADTKVVFSFKNFQLNITEASRWCPYTIYRPIISGKGATLKGHTFDLDVVDMQVTTRYTYDEERQVSIAKHSYVLVIDPKTITRVRQKRNAA